MSNNNPTNPGDPIDEEWRRVISNPQNVIVSDSLKNLLEPTRFELSDDDLHVPSIILLLRFSGGLEINGELIFFERGPQEVRASFVCEKSEAIKVFTDKKIQSIHIQNENEDLDYSIEMMPDDEEPILSFEFDEIVKVRSVGNLIIKM